MISLAKAPRRAWPGLVVGALVLATLAGCAGQTVVEPGALSGPYSVVVKLDPATLNPPNTGSLTYYLTDSAGKPPKGMETVYGALLHSVLISRDLMAFRHTYANQLVDNHASVFTFFPVVNDYIDYAIFKPGGVPEQLLRTDIKLVARPNTDAHLVEDTNLHKTVGWLTFDLLKTPEAIKAGQPEQLAFYVTERGRPVTALWPYLDAPGQFWTVDATGDNFGHEVAASSAQVMPVTPSTTPEGTATTGSGQSGSSGGAATPVLPPTAGPSPTLVPGVQLALSTAVAQPTTQLAPVQLTAQSSILTTPEVVPAVGYGPTVAVTHTFPKPGLYKLWLEVFYRGQLVVVDYVVQVQ